MAPKLHISLLGPLTVLAGDKTVAFRTDAERVLIAYLAAHQGTSQRRDSLAGLLSPDRPDKEALTYLRNRLSRLRKALGDEIANPPYLDIDRKQIGLRDDDHVAVDLRRFERLVTAVERHPHRQLAGCLACLARLEEAAGLVHGELLTGLNFPSETWQAWLSNQREHVQQRALKAMTWLRDAKMALGEWTAVLDIAQRQLAFEPWLEDACRAAMLAHATLGDRNAALAQYETCQQTLWDELGVEPEAETTGLFNKIKAGEEVQGVRYQVSGAATNLPVQTTRFFGREREQTQLIERLVDPGYRLVTLVGTGGIGKTRLALEVAQQVRASFPDGVWFIQLEAINRGMEQIKVAVGEALGLGQTDRQLTGEQVLAVLRNRQLLLIFDNSEAVLEALAFIPEWLRRAPGIAILATSREPLNFAAESVVLLDGLPTETDGTSAAEALFAERAQMARSDFALNSGTLPLVRHICQRVDGSPLAISLAAAWVRRRSLAQIVTEIDGSLDFLRTRLRDVDPRHRSMRAVFETSWQLLEPSEQEVLAELAVFPTDFSAEAAAAVANATPFNLDTLCEKSLLQQTQESERYQLHSLVRQFAGEKLGEGRTAVEQAFFGYYLRHASTHQDDYAKLRSEWLNLSAAVRTAHAHEAWRAVLDLVRTLDEPWFRQIRFGEMREGLRLAVDAAQALDDQPILAQMLLRLGEIEVELNNYAAAEIHLSGAMAHLMQLEDSLGIAQGQYLNGRLKFDQGEPNDALNLLEASMKIFEEEEAWLGVAKVLNLLTLCHLTYGSDLTAAQVRIERSVSLQSHFTASATYVEALRYLGRIKGILGEYEEATAHLIKAEQVSNDLQDLGEYAAVLFERSVLCRRQNRLDEALRFCEACLTHFQTLGSLRWQALVKTQLAILQQNKNHYSLALSLFDESLEIFVELGELYEQAFVHYYLYKLHAEMGQTERSERSRQQALHLNSQINDSQLAKKLAS